MRLADVDIRLQVELQANDSDSDGVNKGAWRSITERGKAERRAARAERTFSIRRGVKARTASRSWDVSQSRPGLAGWSQTLKVPFNNQPGKNKKQLNIHPSSALPAEAEARRTSAKLSNNWAGFHGTESSLTTELS